MQKVPAWGVDHPQWLVACMPAAQHSRVSCPCTIGIWHGCQGSYHPCIHSAKLLPSFGRQRQPQQALKAHARPMGHQVGMDACCRGMSPPSSHSSILLALYEWWMHGLIIGSMGMGSHSFHGNHLWDVQSVLKILGHCNLSRNIAIGQLKISAMVPPNYYTLVGLSKIMNSLKLHGCMKISAFEHT